MAVRQTGEKIICRNGFFDNCHLSLKVSRFSLKKNKFRSDPLAINATTVFTILKSLEYELLERFLVQGRQESFKILHLLKYPGLRVMSFE